MERARKEIVQLHKERNAAIACGYDFVIGVSTQAHKEALLHKGIAHSISSSRDAHDDPKQSPLTLIVYAPALVGKDGRTLDVIHGMEKALPGLRLEWRLSEGGRSHRIAAAGCVARRETVDGGFPLVCNGDASYPVTVNGGERAGLLSPGGQALFEVHAKLPLDEPGIALQRLCLEARGGGGARVWGHATPDDAAVDIAYQSSTHTAEGPPSPRRGLPALKLFKHIRSPETPLLPRVAELLVCRCREGHRVPGPGPRRRAAHAGAAHGIGWVGRAAHGCAARLSTTPPTWTRSSGPTSASRQIGGRESP